MKTHYTRTYNLPNGATLTGTFPDDQTASAVDQALRTEFPTISVSSKVCVQFATQKEQKEYEMAPVLTEAEAEQLVSTMRPGVVYKSKRPPKAWNVTPNEGYRIFYWLRRLGFVEYTTQDGGGFVLT